MSRDVGQIVNGLGISADSLAEDVLVSDAVVLMKCIHSDGTVTLFMAHSDGMSWIERLGMLTAAEKLESSDYRNVDDD